VESSSDQSAKRKPTVFVGSSSEGLAVAREVKYHLQRDAKVTVWDEEGVFKLSKDTLESLIEALDDCNFAILVLTPDDLLESRGVQFLSARDNVLFELGLFMGRHGRERTFALRTRDQDLKVFTDFLSVAVAEYRPPSAGATLRSALAKPCGIIRRQMQKENAKRSAIAEERLLHALSGQYVYLLRHMDQVGDYRPSHYFSHVLYEFNRPESRDQRPLSGSQRPLLDTATQHACRYLKELGLVAVHPLNAEFRITPRGRAVLRQRSTKELYGSAFERRLVPGFGDR
jgi:CAP12/Pycsar effector protein, TIR domain